MHLLKRSLLNSLKLRLNSTTLSFICSQICFVFGFFTTIRETLGFLACTPVFVSELPAIYFNVIYLIVFLLTFIEKKTLGGS